jgi:predicted CoA-binding protein
MPSQHEAFWLDHTTFAVIGNSAAKPFPVLTYKELRQNPDTTVYAVDPSCDLIEGDPAASDLAGLPGPVEAVVLEVPREETAAWIGRGRF